MAQYTPNSTLLEVLDEGEGEEQQNPDGTPQREGDHGGPPLNSEQWIRLVIFEPLPKVKLTRSSYQVTTFLDFLPFLKGF